MTLPESRDITACDLFQASSFYSALSKARSGDKVVLIRLPRNVSARDLEGNTLRFGEDASLLEPTVLVTKTPSPLEIRSDPQTHKVSSVALASPSISSSSDAVKFKLQQKSISAVWTVNLAVRPGEIPMKKIEKVVKARAERPLVEQPRNLRMRLLPFSTPNTKK